MKSGRNRFAMPVCLANVVGFALLVGCAGKPIMPQVKPNAMNTVGPIDSSEVAFPGSIEFADAEFVETSSGLRYRVLRSGNGKKPGPVDTVLSHYKGWLDDGTVFDSSYRRGDPSSFGLDQVIAGWTEGLQLVEEGGMIELEIPYFLGYGDAGSPPAIPAKARLHFVVEVVKIL